MSKGIFVAATGQNVGKTTLCLGILSGLKKRFGAVGFIKPVGQQHVETEDGVRVDKDVELIRKQFDLTSSWEDMSPVLIPPGFTKEFLDGKQSEKAMLESIHKGFRNISKASEFTLVEGTGHVGVGSIVQLNNAKVAKELGMDMIIIASGGLGSSFDEIALNVAQCKLLGVKVRGVILNRVLNDKREMILEYFPKALKGWDIPLVGCIPFNNFLSTPSMHDFAYSFKTPILSGGEWRYRHFSHIRLVAGSLEAYVDEMVPNELIITPGSRRDIIEATIERHMEHKSRGCDFEGGMIITGKTAPDAALIKQMKKADLPALYAPMMSYEAMKDITHFIAKIRKEDAPKVKQAIELVEKHINFDLII